MARLAVIAGGMLAALGICDLAIAVGKWSFAEAGSSLNSASGVQAVDRSRKGDRLPVANAAGETRTITTVEVVGLNAAAIVYRDHDGRVLFRTDPVANVTVVAKDVRLPEVTIRARRDGPTKPLPVEMPDAKKRPHLVGCDPVASPLAGGSVSQLIGRCIAARTDSRQYAVVLR